MFSAFRLMYIGFRVTPASYAPVISFAALVLLSLPASAGPPFVTDDPEPVDYQHYEMYFFSLGTHTAGEISGVALSMAETKCAKWRRESVPVGVREKGFEAPVKFVLPCRFMFWGRGLLRLMSLGFGFGPEPSAVVPSC